MDALSTRTAAPNRAAFGRAFGRFDVHTQSWYAALPSAALRRGRATTRTLLGRRVAFYRDEGGTAHALDARCPHLGADLGQGTVVDGDLVCAFHHWRFDPAGRCVHAPGGRLSNRYARSYPLTERWGMIWLYNGPAPLFDLPAPPAGRHLVVRLPRQHIRCHPHLVIGNGLDASHFEALHGMILTDPPRLVRHDAFRLGLELRGRPASRWLRRLTGSAGGEIRASFITVGGNLAWAVIEEPLRFYVLFSGRPSPHGGCDTRTLVFLPPRALARAGQAAALVYALLRDDRKVLDRLAFRPGFTDADHALASFFALVDALPVG